MAKLPINYTSNTVAKEYTVCMAVQSAQTRYQPFPFLKGTEYSRDILSKLFFKFQSTVPNFSTKENKQD
jgi:hypothetical protein